MSHQYFPQAHQPLNFSHEPTPHQAAMLALYRLEQAARAYCFRPLSMGVAEELEGALAEAHDLLHRREG